MLFLNIVYKTINIFTSYFYLSFLMTVFEMSTNEESTHTSSRVRRSAAMNSNKAWAGLIGNKKDSYNNMEEDQTVKDIAIDEESAQPLEEKSKKRVSKRESKVIDESFDER